MLTKNKVKQIRLLSLKKFRQKHGLFIVEGERAVSEFYNAKWSFNALLISSFCLEGLLIVLEILF